MSDRLPRALGLVLGGCLTIKHCLSNIWILLVEFDRLATSQNIACRTLFAWYKHIMFLENIAKQMLVILRIIIRSPYRCHQFHILVELNKRDRSSLLSYSSNPTFCRKMRSWEIKIQHGGPKRGNDVICSEIWWLLITNICCALLLHCTAKATSCRPFCKASFELCWFLK